MNINTQRDFDLLIKSCRKHGIKSLKIGDISIELTEIALFPKTPAQQKKAAKETIKSVEESSRNSFVEQEQALFWSVNNLAEGN